jgi:WS/DGAT/MGAT family acyltransferase
MSLEIEAPDTPMHLAAVVVADPASGADDRPGLDEARRLIERRLASVPELRQRIHRPGLLAGRPLWVDDPGFRIERHVTEVRLRPPGDETILLAVAEQLLTAPLDRRHPLWHIWFVRGLADGRTAAVIALHHALADGLAAIRLLASLLDTSGPPPAGHPAWTPQPAPTWSALAADNVRQRWTTWRRSAHRPDPGRLAAMVRGAWVTGRHAWPTSRTSLTAPVSGRRVVIPLRLDLTTARSVAHERGVTINDLVLGLVTGGVRALLRSRGEATESVAIHAAVPVSQRSPEQIDDAGNRVGTSVVRLDLSGTDPVSTLDAVHAETVEVKRSQPPAAGQAVMAWLARSGVARLLTRHQRLTDIAVSNIVGPSTPIRLLGAPVIDIVPLGALAGNLALSVLVLSYAGRLIIAVQADPVHFPDLRVVVDGMAHDWTVLSTLPRPALAGS